MKTLRWVGLTFLVSLAAAAAAQAVPLEAVPTPRPGGWSVDLTGTLRAEDLQALDRVAEEVKAQTGAELAVVIVGSTDGAPHRQYATDLANRWGIGDAKKHNGVLVFAALDDRAAEIVLGDGIDGPEQTRAAEEIMQFEMVPRFRAGQPGAAVFYGALSCSRRILGATPTATGMVSESGEASAGTPALPFAAHPAPAPVRQPEPAAAPAPFSTPRSGGGPGFPLLVAALTLSAVAAMVFLVGRRFWPRKCRSCNVRMVRLGEAEDDAHLEPTEKTEERVGSVDYDLWACPLCRRVEKIRYAAFATGYATCPQCGARTISFAETTEVEPTRLREGSVRVVEDCAHCEYRSTSYRTVPRLPEPSYDSDSRWSSSDSSSRSSSSFSSSFSSSSSSSSPSSSSSSSSSSSGFSGGSSSGGGASGRW